MRIDYFKELNVIHQSTQPKGANIDYIDVRYFEATDGLDDECI